MNWLLRLEAESAAYNGREQANSAKERASFLRSCMTSRFGGVSSDALNFQLRSRAVACEMQKAGLGEWTYTIYELTLSMNYGDSA